MNKDFASLFGKWIQDPDDEEANLLLHDILVDNGQEQIAKQFTKKEFVVYSILFDPWDYENLQDWQKRINEHSFSTMAEAEAFMRGIVYYFYPKEEEELIYNVNKKELIAKVTEIKKKYE